MGNHLVIYLTSNDLMYSYISFTYSLTSCGLSLSLTSMSCTLSRALEKASGPASLMSIGAGALC